MRAVSILLVAYFTTLCVAPKARPRGRTIDEKIEQARRRRAERDRHLEEERRLKSDEIRRAEEKLMLEAAQKKMNQMLIFRPSNYLPLIKNGKQVPDGGGSYSRVMYRVEKQQPRREVAIRIIKGAKALKYVATELKVLEMLKQNEAQNVIRLIDSFRDEDKKTIYIVMDYIRGEPLDTLITDPKWNPAESLVCRLFGELITALWYMDQLKIYHRDIKAANIMIAFGKRSQKMHLTLIDYGISKILEKENNYKVTGLDGSEETMAPETLLQIEQDTRADLWSAFVILVMIYRRSTDRIFNHICTDTCMEEHFDPDRYDAAVAEEMRTGELILPSSMPILAQDLVRRALKFNPDERPSFQEIMRDKWFQQHNVHFPAEAIQSEDELQAEDDSMLKPPGARTSQRRRSDYNRSKRGSRRTQNEAEPVTPEHRRQSVSARRYQEMSGSRRTRQKAEEAAAPEKSEKAPPSPSTRREPATPLLRRNLTSRRKKDSGSENGPPSARKGSEDRGSNRNGASRR